MTSTGAESKTCSTVFPPSPRFERRSDGARLAPSTTSWRTSSITNGHDRPPRGGRRHMTKTYRLRPMLHETVEATRTDVGSWAPGNERFAFSRRRHSLDRLRATALPALCIFAANTVVVVTHAQYPRAIVSAAILTLVYLA